MLVQDPSGHTVGPEIWRLVDPQHSYPQQGRGRGKRGPDRRRTGRGDIESVSGAGTGDNRKPGGIGPLRPLPPVLQSERRRTPSGRTEEERRYPLRRLPHLPLGR